MPSKATPEYLTRLGRVTAWHGYTRPGGEIGWRRTTRGYLLTPVYRFATWARWKTGRGPLCGDPFCSLKDHWPDGKPLYP